MEIYSWKERLKVNIIQMTFFPQVDVGAQFTHNKNPSRDLFVLNCLFSFMIQILCVCVSACSS